MTDNVNHPPHYTSHPSGIECIEVTRHMTFNIGNAIKYCWRAGLKCPAPDIVSDDEWRKAEKLRTALHIQDLKKAQWYLADEIKRLEKINANT